MERRGFVTFCAASAAAAAAPASFSSLGADSQPRLYTRARLVDGTGSPLYGKSVPRERNLIFHYPYASTPCFLLNLGRPAPGAAQLRTANQQVYEWRGGVGAGRSIVAYSAICAHRLTYPTKDISFISYRAEKSARNRFGSVIHCCSEHSQYDPAEGARVLAGPAPQPLAAILLEHDAATDELYAVGTLGGEMFNEFFDKFAFKLQLEHGAAARAAAGNACTVLPLEDYCRQQVKC
ncbi:MAG TPA: (2Fe-2S)-binding protein [Burkholderiales bacterium]|nr:(2Fe-2S)-binding protein [Burkholderiales bacterium]